MRLGGHTTYFENTSFTFSNTSLGIIIPTSLGASQKYLQQFLTVRPIVSILNFQPDSCTLRLGLPSKEIASLLNISLRSVETFRYRLRKKLGLEQGESMTDFFRHL